MGLSLGGCVDLAREAARPQPPEVTQPLAADLARRHANPAAYPAFFEVPGQPTDLRPKSAWTRNIYNTLRLRRQLAALEALNPQSLYGAQAFAQVGRLRAEPPPTAGSSTAQGDQTADFAQQGRARATPPSPTP
jgi:hypothetical protein